MSISRLFSSLSFRLQTMTIILSLVGVFFGIKSYLHIRTQFGVEASGVFFDDLALQLVVAVIFNVVAAFIIHCIASKPIRSLGEVMRALTQEKLDIDVPYTQQGTEIGSMARKVEIFKKNALDKKNLEQSQKAQEQKAQDEKKQMLHDLAHRFETKIQGIVKSVLSQAKHLESVSQSMTSLVGDVSEKAGGASHAADDTLKDIQSVVGSVQEINESSSEIARQMNNSSQAVTTTVQASDKTDKISQHLGEASERISDIIIIIQGIADQINLLALNATIESARAGEAGKGFAVVANEVKNLAVQTKNATSQIVEHVDNVRHVTSEVIAAMGEIKSSIQKVDQSSSIVNSALVEQERSMGGISTSINDAAAQTAHIVSNVKRVMEASLSAKTSTHELHEAVTFLTAEGSKLGKEVSEFVHEIERG